MRPIHFYHALVICLGLSAVVARAASFSVYTVNYPLQYFAERIGAGHIDVVLPVPEGVDPAHWQPERDALRGFQDADLVLSNGAGYAGWLDHVSLSSRKLVNTSSAFAENYISVEAPQRYSRGTPGEHSHTATASVTWLDFQQAAQQADSIRQALVKRLPQHAEDFERAYQLLHEDLMKLDLALQRVVASRSGKHFLAAQPVYHYLARRYELDIKDMRWPANRLPDESSWTQLRFIQESFLARWMLWDALPPDEVTERLKSQNIGSLAIATCASRPADGDFLSVMQGNIDRLRSAYND